MATTPRWYTIVAIIALIWNLLGCLAVFSDLMMKPEQVATLSVDQRALFASRTTWSVIASVVAVIGGAIGSLGLLLRKRWAMPFLILSLAGLIIQDFGLFIIANGIKLAGPSALVIQVFVLLIAIGLVQLARFADNRGRTSEKSQQVK